MVCGLVLICLCLVLVFASVAHAWVCSWFSVWFRFTWLLFCLELFISFGCLLCLALLRVYYLLRFLRVNSVVITDSLWYGLFGC